MKKYTLSLLLTLLSLSYGTAVEAFQVRFTLNKGYNGVPMQAFLVDIPDNTPYVVVKKKAAENLGIEEDQIAYFQLMIPKNPSAFQDETQWNKVKDALKDPDSRKIFVFLKPPLAEIKK